MKYKAFISYSHEDEKIAGKLHRALENYKVSRDSSAYSHTNRGKVQPIFRDKDELQTSSDLSDSLKRHLDDSETLIVLCSRASATSYWVNQEIRYFIEKRGAEKVFPVLISGDLKTSVPPAITERNAEHLITIKKNLGFSKTVTSLIAGILGCRFEELWQRHKRASYRRAVAIAAGVLTVGALAVSFGWYTLNKSFEGRWNAAWTGMSQAKQRFYLSALLAARDRPPVTLAEKQALDEVIATKGAVAALTYRAPKGESIYKAALSHNQRYVYYILDSGAVYAFDIGKAKAHQLLGPQCKPGARLEANECRYSLATLPNTERAVLTVLNGNTWLIDNTQGLLSAKPLVQHNDFSHRVAQDGVAYWPISSPAFVMFAKDGSFARTFENITMRFDRFGRPLGEESTQTLFSCKVGGYAAFTNELRYSDTLSCFQNNIETARTVASFETLPLKFGESKIEPVPKSTPAPENDVGVNVIDANGKPRFLQTGFGYMGNRMGASNSEGNLILSFGKKEFVLWVLGAKACENCSPRQTVVQMCRNLQLAGFKTETSWLKGESATDIEGYTGFPNDICKEQNRWFTAPLWP